MRKFVLILTVAASLCFAADAQAGCLRGGARAAKAGVGKAVKFVGRILPPWRR